MAKNTMCGIARKRVNTSEWEDIMFFFALGKNPIKEYKKKISSKSDAENIAQDWFNIGNDIRSAYKKYRTQQG